MDPEPDGGFIASVVARSDGLEAEAEVSVGEKRGIENGEVSELAVSESDGGYVAPVAAISDGLEAEVLVSVSASVGEKRVVENGEVGELVVSASDGGSIAAVAPPDEKSEGLEVSASVLLASVGEERGIENGEVSELAVSASDGGSIAPVAPPEAREGLEVSVLASVGEKRGIANGEDSELVVLASVGGSIAPVAVRSDGLEALVSVGEKRAIEVGEDCEMVDAGSDGGSIAPVAPPEARSEGLEVSLASASVGEKRAIDNGDEYDCEMVVPASDGGSIAPVAARSDGLETEALASVSEKRGIENGEDSELVLEASDGGTIAPPEARSEGLEVSVLASVGEKRAIENGDEYDCEMVDPASDGGSIAPIAPPDVRSEGLEVSALASVGEKRAIENGDGDEYDCELVNPVPKRARKDDVFGGNVKKVAELVLVLATLGKMRGGGNPTAAEVDMMAEAREKLAEICVRFAPKDVFPMDSFGAIIEDLGLSKLKDQKSGFRAPKMSIAEKMLLTKLKMEKAEQFSLHSAPYTPQRPQTNPGPAAENRGTSHPVHTFPTDKSIGFQTPSPLGHVSAVKSTTSSLPYQLPTSEVRPPIAVSSGLPSSNLVRVSSAQSSGRVDRPHFRLDGRANSGSSYKPQVQANSSGDHMMVKTPTWSVQPQSTSSGKTASDNKSLAHIYAKTTGTADISMSQAATSRPFITQTTPANLPTIHPNLQGRSIVPPHSSNSHVEIGKIIQKLLQPQIPQQPTWTPPSRDYMNKAVTCQMCKLTINEVECLLVCDACEKSYHLKCLQCNNPKTIPRGEWHCGKCLALSNGKPLPPKYGRVMRNATTTSKVSVNTPAVHSTSEKNAVTSEEKVNQRIAPNGNSVPQSAPTSNLVNNYSDSPFSLKMADTREMLGNNDDDVVKNSNIASVSPIELSVGHTCEENLANEKRDTTDNLSGASEAVGNPQNIYQTRVESSDEKLSKPSWHDANVMVKELEKCSSAEALDCSQNSGIKQDKQGITRPNNPVETSGTSVETGEHNVEWLGDIYQVVDEKTYYKSCCINGVVYKVNDHALFRSSHKLMPFKLQAMWEDNKTRLRWVAVNRCYLPEDLPADVGRPCAPESDEVYDSNHGSTVMAKLIEGPCEVLPPNNYVKESEKRSRLRPDESARLWPLFLCKWFYDESKGLFRDVSC